MNNSYANKCIACTVSECINHNSSENYCSLQSIRIGTHGSNPKEDKCTDCESFQRKSGCC